MKIGGVLHLDSNSNGSIAQSNFTKNRAENCGGVVMTSSSSNITIVDSSFYNNEAKRGAIMVILKSSSIFTNTFPCMNHANKKLTVNCRESEIHIINNRAEFGGAIYLSKSKIYFNSVTLLNYNQATSLGGGIFAIHSSITIGSTVIFYGNNATRGGAISLGDSMLHGNTIASEGKESNVKFLSNRTYKGGAVYIVDDEGEKKVCYNIPYAAIHRGACFFHNVTNNLRMNFTDNYTNFSGHKDVLNSESSGVTRLKEISNMNLKTVSSRPVRVCLCKNNTPDCNQLTHSIQVKRGNLFTIPVVAADQVRSSKYSTIHSRLKGAYLPENQTIHKIDINCTSLMYKIFFPEADTDYKLTMYPEGPCSDKGISVVNITIHILNCLCPPGFMKTASTTECACTCDKRLTSFIKECDSDTKTVLREGNFWITYLGDSNNDSSSPYLIYPYCPLDYCQPPSMSVPINLSLTNGSDTQCANHRGGLLCGSCLPGYSLSLGTSKCVKCHSHSHGLVTAILLAFSLAGIVLVALIFLLNLTTAVGTLNSIILYVNIIDASMAFTSLTHT